MKFDLSPNPVLVKELRGRMRGPRAYFLLAGSLSLLGLVMYGFYRLIRYSAETYGGGGQQSASIGQGVFISLAFLAVGLICFVTPALTASAISSEHERKTFDMLMATPLHPAAVLLGKLLGALSYVALLITAIIPLASLAYVFGGVAVRDMVQAWLLLLGYAVTFGVIGLFFSTLVRRSGLATILSYATVGVFVLGTTLAYGAYGIVRQTQPPAWILTLNPFSAMAAALAAPGGPGLSSMGGVFNSLLWLLGGGGFDSTVAPGQAPLWQYTVGAYAILTMYLYIFSAIWIRPVRRWRLGGRGWGGVSALIIVSILAVPVVYGPWSPGNIWNWVMWQVKPKINLVRNGDFAAALNPVWAVTAEVEQAGEPGGQIERATDGLQHILRITRTGAGHAEAGVTQIISQALPAEITWLQVRAVLRVNSQEVPMCGMLGSECPVMIKLVYGDGAGGAHTWMQGFFAEGDWAMSSTPPMCTLCEINQPHIKVPPGQWYTYESDNLMQDMARRGYYTPRSIQAVMVTAGGHSFAADIAEIAVLIHAGDLPIGLGGALTPTPLPMMIQREWNMVKDQPRELPLVAPIR